MRQLYVNGPGASFPLIRASRGQTRSFIQIELASDLVRRRAFDSDERLLQGRLPAKAGNAMEMA